MFRLVKKSSGLRSTEEYHPHIYWSRVAQAIERRSEGNVLAGDDTPFLRYQRSVFLSKFLDQIPVQEKAVLEVGCGPGGNLVRIARAQPRKLVGCDVSEAMTKLARKNTRDLREVDIVQVNGTALPFNDCSFDLTYTVTVLQHNEDAMLTKLLPEICRVTADRLYLFEITGLKQEWFSFVLRPVSEYAELCAAHGFELIETEVLRLSTSQNMSYSLNRAFNLLHRTLGRERKEGEPITKIHASLEEAALSITRIFDKVVSPRHGLAKMMFQRKS